MKKRILFFAAAWLLICGASPGWAGEINVNWRAHIDSASIYDMEFMPGQDNFIIVTPHFLQVRSCEDGAIIKTELITTSWTDHDLEFTPDSNNILLCYNNTIESRNAKDLKLLKSMFLKSDPDGYDVSFVEMKVDPKKPFIYLLRHQQQHNSNNKISRKVVIYNYNILEYVGDLPLGNDTNVTLQNLAISKDGKYAACTNYGPSKIMVWSLDSRQRICDKYISQESWNNSGDPSDLKFSEINSDLIYFAGEFPQGLDKETYYGLSAFRISENRVIDSTFAVGEKQTNIFHFDFFDQSKKIFGTGGGYIFVLNLTQNLIEYKNDNSIQGGIYATIKTLFNSSKNYFIGGGGTFLNKFLYSPQTGVDEIKTEVVIYPNPTDGIVNLPINCNDASKYEIYNSTGNQIKTFNLSGIANNLIAIDFSGYQAGTYYIKLYCGKQVSNYRIVKKG